MASGAVNIQAPKRNTDMVDTVMDPERGILQDGRMPQEFLEDLFEYEYCAECGGDTEDHIFVLDVLGLFHAHYLTPPIF